MQSKHIGVKCHFDPNANLVSFQTLQEHNTCWKLQWKRQLEYY
jgi:hypothetical protein